MSQQSKLGKHATSVYQSDGLTCVRYHSTEVVRFDKDHTILDSGGWQTATTKTRMNQAASQFGLGFDVFQKDWSWFVRFAGRIASFTDGMQLNADGTVTA